MSRHLPGNATAFPPSSSPSESPHAGNDVRNLASTLIELMDALTAVLQQETELVTAGKLRAASELAAAKADLAGRYQAASVRLKAAGRGRFAAEPTLSADLRARHERFRGLLQLNQTVLATAHAVSEGLIRGAAGEVARKATPQGYGARGQAVGPPQRTAQPVALSRSY